MGSNHDIEHLAAGLIDAALTVHRALGPGLLESVYQKCLTHEMRRRNIPVRCEVALPITYGDVRIDAGYRIDMLIGESIIVENKTVETLTPIHEAQLLTYLRLSGHRLGFLINWNVPLIKHGIKRMVLGL